MRITRIASERRVRFGPFSLGYSDLAETYEVKRGCDLQLLHSNLLSYLQSTDDAYMRLMATYTPETRQQQVRSLLRSIVAQQQPFRQIDVSDVSRAFLGQVGISSTGIELRVDEDALFRGGAFCEFDVSTRHIQVTTGPIVSSERLADVLHELGHAAHFKMVPTTLQVEEQIAGDDGLVEAWGVAFENFFAPEDFDVPSGGSADQLAIAFVLMRAQAVRFLFVY